MSTPLARPLALALALLLPACGGEDPDGDRASIDADDAIAARTPGAADDDVRDDADQDDDADDDGPAHDAPPVTDGDDAPPATDDDGPAPPTFSEAMAAAMAVPQVLRCRIGEAEVRLVLDVDHAAYAVGVNNDIDDTGTWALAGESVTVSFPGFEESTDPAATTLVSTTIFETATPSMDCNVDAVVGVDALDGLVAHCPYDGTTELMLSFYDDGEFEYYEEYDIQIDTLRYTWQSAYLFVGDVVALLVPYNDNAAERIQAAVVDGDGLHLLSDAGNIDRTCPWQ